jgi:outer membrane protein assembly factor BamA
MRINKHYGRLVSNQTPVVVLFMELADEPDSCLYVDWNIINTAFQSELAQIATSTQGQAAYDLGPVLATVKMEQNKNLLQVLHEHRLISKTNHLNVEMQSSYETFMNLATIVAAVRELRNTTEAEPKVEAKVEYKVITEPTVTILPVVQQTTNVELEQKVEAIADQMAQMQAMMSQLMTTLTAPKTVSE